jgi:arylsulfatase A-like enzyme
MKSFAVLILLLAGAPLQAQDRPNIIFIMADDLGNADLGYRGGQVISRNLDALAAEGVRLESFYGEPLCTPSRAALMTGRYPQSPL